MKCGVTKLANALYLDGYPHHENSNHGVPFLNCIKVEEKLSLNGIVKQSEIQEIIHHNLQVKSAAYRAIKRPGRSKFRFLCTVY